MTAKRRKGPGWPPLVYLDACVFGVTAHSMPENRPGFHELQAAKASLQSLLYAFEGDQFGFVDSIWTRAEIRLIRPPHRLRRVLRSIPGRAAKEVGIPPNYRLVGEMWASLLHLEKPEGWKDGLHVAMAVEAKADFLVTFDRELYDRCRKVSNPKVLRGLRVVFLTTWIREVGYER